jgi:urea transport system permease protein
MNAPAERFAIVRPASPRVPIVLRGGTRFPPNAILVALLFAVFAFAAVPVLHLVVPAGNALHLSDYFVTLVGKILCYAIVAVALDLIWGYAGVLSLGHGLFFALGGYAFGMYLMRQIGRDGSYKADLPDFMVFLDWKALPWYWQGTDHFLSCSRSRRCSRSRSATSRSARGSRACTSRSSRRR